MGYEDSPEMPQDSSFFSPRKYSLEATSLPPERSAAKSEFAVLIAHLPEHAQFWVEGRLTRVGAQTSYFRSPPLLPSKKYSYMVRAVWVEDGRWVSQTQKVPVRAGLVQAVYLRPR